MKKIILSTVAVATLTTFATADANDYSNLEIKALKLQMKEMQTKLLELEKQKTKSNSQFKSVESKEHKQKGSIVKSKVPVLKFSGKHYLGFVSSQKDREDRANKFETRRNYFQVKAYFKDSPKDYARVTLDTHNHDGDSQVRLKYAYLYLDSVFPNTGVEFGQVHRPWIDYEEHNGWNYRSISKVYVEDDNGAHLTNSSDRGINFKTKTPYFSSELGVFNGEGYHNEEDGEGLSGEWRLTGHLLGTGKEHTKKSSTYANFSLFGQKNKKSNKHKNQDLNWAGIHAVYNQPEFLIAGQFITIDDGDAKYKGEGYSINGEYRFAPKWNVIGRYDYFDMDDNSGEKKRAIAGLTHRYNKNVEFIASYLVEGASKLGVRSDAIMFTSEINW